MNQEMKYALLFLCRTAQEVRPEPVTVRQIAQEYHLSAKFLEQIVARLRKAGMVVAQRGRNGGYRLAPGKCLTALDVYQVLHGENTPIACELADGCRGGVQCTQKEMEAKMLGKVNDELAGLQIVK